MIFGHIIVTDSTLRVPPSSESLRLIPLLLLVAEHLPSSLLGFVRLLPALLLFTIIRLLRPLEILNLQQLTIFVDVFR